MSCTHDWQRYVTLPGGEDMTKYFQCSLCGCIGFRGFSGLNQKARIKLLHCSCKKCGKVAIGRNWGRTSLGRPRWCCADHVEKRDTDVSV